MILPNTNREGELSPLPHPEALHARVAPCLDGVELVLAQLAVGAAALVEPALQAGQVHVGQGACANRTHCKAGSKESGVQSAMPTRSPVCAPLQLQGEMSRSMLPEFWQIRQQQDATLGRRSIAGDEI